MQRYKVKIEPEALADIQEITEWYNELLPGLGKRFQTTAIKQISGLNKNPQIYSVRYNEIRCMIIGKFPYMVHFFIKDKNNIIEVLAVIGTDRNPKLWKEKTSGNP